MVAGHPTARARVGPRGGSPRVERAAHSDALEARAVRPRVRVRVRAAWLRELVCSLLASGLVLVVSLTGPPALADGPAEPAAADQAFDFGDLEGSGDGGADQGFDFGDLDDGGRGEGTAEDQGFDFGDVETSAPEAPPARPFSLSLGGFLRSDWGLWAERLGPGDNPFAKARQSLDVELRFKLAPLRLQAAVHLEYDFAYLNRLDTYDGPTLDAYMWLIDSRELLAALDLGKVEITFGRLITAWGQGDMLSLLDVVSQRDNREPGLADVADIRLPALATRLGLYLGAHRLELTVVHEANFGYRSPPFGPFSPFEALMSDDARRMLGDKTLSWRDVQPRFALEDQQLFLRWGFQGQGFDLELCAASLLDQQGVIVLPEALASLPPGLLPLLCDGSALAGGGADLDAETRAALAGLSPEQLAGLVELGAATRLALRLDHRRYHVVGASGAVPWGSWLFKWELGAQIGRAFNVGDPADLATLGVAEGSTFDLMLGVTFSGLENTQIGFEMSKRTFIDEPEALVFRPDAPTFALRLLTRQLRERLTLTVVALLMGWDLEYGWLARAEATYEVTADGHIGAGLVTYHPGEALGPLSGLRSHDRGFVKLRWDFTML